MPVIVYRPRAPLDLIVERLWWHHRAKPSARREHNLPTGKVQLVIALHDGAFTWSRHGDARPTVWTGGIIHGPQSGYYLTGPKPRGSVVGAAFHPGAAAAVLGVPIGDLTDRHITLEELWGRPGRLLHERLAATTTPQAAFALLEAALSARLRLPLLVHPAVALALRGSSLAATDLTVAELRQHSGYSAKHFIARFRSALGLTPKQYLRIQRFGRLAERLAAGHGEGTLAEVADAAGYADQSHMTREFRALAGTTPTGYRPAEAARAYHHVVADPELPGKNRSRRTGPGSL